MFPTEVSFTSNEWLTATGDCADVAISSRLRLARNLQDVPFTRWALPDDLATVVSRFRRAVVQSTDLSSLTLVDFPRLTLIEKEFLCERHLVSREFVENTRECVLALNNSETLCIMVNEEDHFRMQAIRSGIDLQSAWEELNAVDDKLETKLRFAFDERWGYFTACPTNVGTGLRCSVMLHLPGLVLAQQIGKVLAAAAQLGLAVRGFFGEGSENIGHLYQVSNQTTLGSSEADILKRIDHIARQIASNERQVQQGLFEHVPCLIEDRVWRAYGLLTHARMISTREALEKISDIRLGVNLGFDLSISLQTCNDLLITAQPAHLQRIAGKAMESSERDSFRADLIRQRIS